MKVQGFLLTQAGWGGAGQEEGPGRGELGRRCGKRREGRVDGMGNIRVGVDVAEMRCQVGGGGLEMQIVHKRYWGKRGALGTPRRSPCHLPIMPSGTEYHANKLRSILSLDTPFILPLFTFPETYVSSGDTTPWSPLQCRLFILPAPGSSGQEVGSLSFLVLIAASPPPGF